MLGSNKRLETCFHQALAPAALLATAVCGLLYAGVWLPPLRSTFLFHYAFCHPMATVVIWLGCLANVVLALKWSKARTQYRIAKEACESLDELVEHRGLLPGEADLLSIERAEGLDTLWRTQKRAWTQSWFGQRVSAMIARQLHRRSVERLDDDFKELAARDRQSQRDSYSLLTLLGWAIPTFGIVGCLSSLARSLGQLPPQGFSDSNAFPTQEWIRGLASAFDPLWVGVLVAMSTLLLRFLAQREEARLLNRIDDGVHGALHRCLSQAETATNSREIEVELRAISLKLMDTVEVLVRRQTELWRDAISGAHDHWQRLSTGASEAALVGVRQAISETLDDHRQKLREDVERLTSLQSEGAAQIDGRLQQWQTTISEQARVSLRHQQELNRQTETLERLLQSSQLVAAMQAPMAASLERLSDMERFHEAAVSLSEAITVLGAQVEQIAHAGPSVQRRVVLRRRNESSGNVVNTDGDAAGGLPQASNASIEDPDCSQQDEGLERESESQTISIPIAPHTASHSVFRTPPSATSGRTRRAG